METNQHVNLPELKQQATWLKIVIRTFFNYYSLQEAQAMNWQWTKAAIKSNLSRHERDNLLAYYEELQKLLVACYLQLKENGKRD